MGLARRFGVFAVFLLLVATVAAGNVVIAGHQTVLDPGFVSESLDEENAYGTALDLAATESPLAAAGNDSRPALVQNATRRVVTPAYLRNQTEPNVQRTYAYFHGERGNLSVVVRTDPLIERTDDAVEATVANASVRELVTAVGVPVPAAGPVNRSLILGLTDGPESYAESRATLRNQTREQIVESSVDRAFEEASNDERLALVIENYDPDEYTDEEKRQMVADREPEIRAALREQIESERGDEIDRQVTARLDDSRATLKAEFAAPETGLGEDVDRAATNLTAVFVDGLLAPNYTHDAFQGDLDTRKAELGAALGDAAQQRLDDQLPSELRPLADQTPEEQRAVRQARQAVQILDALGVALPALVVGLVAVLRLVSGTWATTALWTGLAGAVGAAPLVVATQFRDRLTTRIEANATDEAAAELAVALVGRLFDVVATQSLGLVVVGLSLATVGAIVRTGLLSKH